MKKPMYPIRPMGVAGAGAGAGASYNAAGAAWLDRSAMLCVFAKLTPHELATCALVCKAWAEYSVSTFIP